MQVSNLPKGTNKARLALAKAATNNGERESIVDYCRERWGEGAAVVLLARELVTRTAVPGLDTIGHDALSPDAATLEVVEPIIERSVFRGANIVPLNVRIAVLSDHEEPAWMAEGEGIPVSQHAISYVTLRAKRIATMDVITEELARLSQAEAIIRRHFNGLFPRAVNDAALDINNAGSATKPAALTCGLPIRETLAGLMNDFTGALDRAVWYGTPEVFLSMQSNVNPDLGIAGGTYMGSPAIASRSAPSNALTLIDPTGIYVGLGPLEIDAARNASFVMDDDPSQSSVAPTAANVNSMFQENAVALRAQLYCNWYAAPGSVAMIEIEPGSPI